MSPGIVECAAPDEARRQARLKLQEKLELQRCRHLRLAIDLAGDESSAAKMVARARDRAMSALAEDQKKFSPPYRIPVFR